MEEQFFEGFEFSWRRSYGFCFRLFFRLVLGFSVLSSASSCIFLAKLFEVLTKNNEKQVKRGEGGWGGLRPPPPSKGSRKHAQSKPRSSKNHLKISETGGPLASWCSWAEKIVFQEAKTAPKSINKNQSKSSFRALLFAYRFYVEF